MRELKKFSLGKASNFLSEAEMMRVTGGYSSGCMSFTFGTCGWNGPSACMCGVDKSTAQQYADWYGGNWCCDSCGSTSYCG